MTQISLLNITLHCTVSPRQTDSPGSLISESRPRAVLQSASIVTRVCASSSMRPPKGGSLINTNSGEAVVSVALITITPKASGASFPPRPSPQDPLQQKSLFLLLYFHISSTLTNLSTCYSTPTLIFCCHLPTDHEDSEES